MSEGALVIPVAQEDDKKEMPPLILLKSDGAVLYGTTDLATIIDRVREQNPDLILYVVDQRQHSHFEQVFRAARNAGLNGKAALEHAGFGTMNGADGKTFKTRSGGVMKLYDLIGMATEEANKRLVEQGIGADYPQVERNAIARAVGLSAIKFADLTNFRTSDYVFDLTRFTRFEGKTGPYLQYLAIADAMESAEMKRAPNVLCDYVFAVAQEFSRFYAAHHILSEPEAGLRAARLGLCVLTLSVLQKLLEILGIEVPARM